MISLSPRQAALKAFIAQKIARGEGGPSIEEMRVALGLSTKSLAHAQVTELERRGHIRRLRLTAARNARAVKRAIEIVPPKACSHCGRSIDG